MRAQRAWTHAEEEALRVLAPYGGRYIAAVMDRTHQSVRDRAAVLGVKLGRKGSATNPPQPAPSADPAALRLVAALATADLCPSCGKRPIGVKKTGLCGCCHLEALKSAHEEAIAKADAQRELWASRARLARRRKAIRAARGDFGPEATP